MQHSQKLQTMKSSPSSSSTSNFYTTKGNTLSCFSGFLSRILNSKTQQTDPSETGQLSTIIDGLGTPNVVARLMGLEFMPEFSLKDNKKSWKSSFRSKSIDLEENRVETEDMKGMGIHRRVKTSFSFRETPSYFEVEDDNFFVLSFEDRGVKKSKNRKCRKKQRKNRVVFSDEERVSLKVSPRNCEGFDDDFEVSKRSYPFKEKISVVKEDKDGISLRKKKEKGGCSEVVSKGEVECELENYSPVSVLDDCEFVSESEVTVSNFSEEDAKSRGSECESKELPCSSNERCREEEIKKQGNEGEKKLGLERRRRNNNYRKHENIEMLRRVDKLGEEELSNSKWKYRGIMLNAQELENLGLDFSQYIFDKFIIDLVDDLVE